jgi:hypothetical protein
MNLSTEILGVIGGVIVALLTFFGVMINVRATKESNRRTTELSNIQQQLDARDEQIVAWREDAKVLRRQIQDDRKDHILEMKTHKLECTESIKILELRVDRISRQRQDDEKRHRQERIHLRQENTALQKRVDDLVLWARSILPLLLQSENYFPPLPAGIEDTIPPLSSEAD